MLGRVRLGSEVGTVVVRHSASTVGPFLCTIHTGTHQCLPVIQHISIIQCNSTTSYLVVLGQFGVYN